MREFLELLRVLKVDEEKKHETEMQPRYLE